jgi:hypothetical protein
VSDDLADVAGDVVAAKLILAFVALACAMERLSTATDLLRKRLDEISQQDQQHGR